MKARKMKPGVRYTIKGLDRNGDPNWVEADAAPVHNIGHVFQVGNIKRTEDTKNRKIHKKVKAELSRGRKRIEGAKPLGKNERQRSHIRTDAERKRQG